MRAPRSVTVLTALALLGLGAAGCATQVRAHGQIDPAATVSDSPTATDKERATPARA